VKPCLLLLVIFLAGCELPIDMGIGADLSIRGTLRSAATSEPVPRALVGLLQHGSQPLVEVRTDANGRYALSLRVVSERSCDALVLTAARESWNANEYAILSRDLKCTSRGQHIDLALEESAF
jgi:hypothetical protein